MKFLITYSSRTGNTKKVAEALAKAAPAESRLANVDEKPLADGYDVVFAGYWLDRGSSDDKGKKFLHSLHGKKVVLFETMGADPVSEHAYTGFANAGLALSEDNHVIGVLAIQGAIDPSLLETMRKLPKDNPHNSSFMEKAAKEAAKHPDEEDLKKAENYMKQFVGKFMRYYR